MEKNVKNTRIESMLSPKTTTTDERIKASAMGIKLSMPPDSKLDKVLKGKSYPDTAAPSELEQHNDSQSEPMQDARFAFFESKEVQGNAVEGNEKNIAAADSDNAQDDDEALLPATALVAPSWGLYAAGGLALAAAGGGGGGGGGSSTPIDTTPPAKPAAISSFKDNVGPVQSTSNKNTNTDDTTPGLFVGAGLTDTLRLFDNGNEVEAIYTSTNGFLTPKNPLSEGMHALTYTLTDAAGNESGQSLPLNMTIDTTAPTTTASGWHVVDQTHTVVESGGATFSTNLNMAGSLSVGLVAGEVVKIYDGKTYLGNATLQGTGWVFQDNERAVPNKHEASYTARVADAAGNESTASTPFTVKVLAPISLGPGKGQLINGILADGGHTYYEWDINGDNKVDTKDRLSYFEIATHMGMKDPSELTASNRSATINGVSLKLPTVGWLGWGGIAAGVDGYIPNTAANSRDTNSSYDDFAAIWDMFTNKTQGNGFPPTWGTGSSYALADDFVSYGTERVHYIGSFEQGYTTNVSSRANENYWTVFFEVL